MTDERVYLLPIRDAIDRILTYTEEGRDAFLGHPMIQDAVRAVPFARSSHRARGQKFPVR